jgi:hypothetical protein
MFNVELKIVVSQMSKKKGEVEEEEQGKKEEKEREEEIKVINIGKAELKLPVLLIYIENPISPKQYLK